jgi:hypothetical protein
VDYDNEMLVMNMWFKIVESKPHNFEILAKFLIHNLSSFIMKLRANSSKENASSTKETSQVSRGLTTTNLGGDEAYGIEYEK